MSDSDEERKKKPGKGKQQKKKKPVTSDSDDEPVDVEPKKKGRFSRSRKGKAEEKSSDDEKPSKPAKTKPTKKPKKEADEFDDSDNSTKRNKKSKRFSASRKKKDSKGSEEDEPKKGRTTKSKSKGKSKAKQDSDDDSEQESNPPGRKRLSFPSRRPRASKKKADSDSDDGEEGNEDSNRPLLTPSRHRRSTMHKLKSCIEAAGLQCLQREPAASVARLMQLGLYYPETAEDFSMAAKEKKKLRLELSKLAAACSATQKKVLGSSKAGGSYDSGDGGEKLDLKSLMLGIHVHNANSVPVDDPKVMAPLVRVHVLDATTGRYLAKSDPAAPSALYHERATVVPADPSGSGAGAANEARRSCPCTFLLPAMTKPTKLEAGAQLGVWDEVLTINESLSSLLLGPKAASTLLLFELLDLGLRAKPRHLRLVGGMYGVAWGYLRPAGAVAKGAAVLGMVDGKRDGNGNARSRQQKAAALNPKSAAAKAAEEALGSTDKDIVDGRRQRVVMYRYRKLPLLARQQARQQGLLHGGPPVPPVFLQYLLQRRQRVRCTLTISLGAVQRPSGEDFEAALKVDRKLSAMAGVESCPDRQWHQVTGRALLPWEQEVPDMPFAQLRRMVEGSASALAEEAAPPGMDFGEDMDDMDDSMVRASRRRRGVGISGGACQVPSMHTPLHRLPVGDTGALVVSFSPRGTLIAVACVHGRGAKSNDGGVHTGVGAGCKYTIAVYDVATGILKQELQGHSGLIYDLCWSQPNGNGGYSGASSSGGGAVEGKAGGTNNSQDQGQEGGEGNSSGSGTGTNGSVGGQGREQWGRGESDMEQVLLSCSADGTSRVWSVAKLHHRQPQHGAMAPSSPDNDNSSSGSSFSTSETPSSSAKSPHSNNVLSPSASPMLPPDSNNSRADERRWRGSELCPQELVRMVHTPPVYVYCAAWYNSLMFEREQNRNDKSNSNASSGNSLGKSGGTLVVTGAYDHKVRLWNGGTGQLLGVLGDQPHHHLDVHRSHVNVLVAHGRQHRLYSGDAEGRLCVWRLKARGNPYEPRHYICRQILHPALVGKAITCLRLHPNPVMQQLLVQAERSTLLVHTGFAGARAERASSRMRASFSADGEMVLAGTEDGAVCLWESQTGMRMELPGSICDVQLGSAINDVAWSPSEHLVALSCFGGSAAHPLLLYAWERQDGAPVPPPPVPERDVHGSDAFRRGVAGAGGENAEKKWDVLRQQLRERRKERLTQKFNERFDSRMQALGISSPANTGGSHGGTPLTYPAVKTRGAVFARTPLGGLNFNNSSAAASSNDRYSSSGAGTGAPADESNPLIPVDTPKIKKKKKKKSRRQTGD